MFLHFHASWWYLWLQLAGNLWNFPGTLSFLGTERQPLGLAWPQFWSSLSRSRIPLSCLFLKGVPSLLPHNWRKSQIPEGNKQQRELGQKWEERICSNWPMNDLDWGLALQEALCPTPFYKRQTQDPPGSGGWVLENSLERNCRALTGPPGHGRAITQTHTVPRCDRVTPSPGSPGLLLPGFPSIVLQGVAQFCGRNQTSSLGSASLRIKSNSICEIIYILDVTFLCLCPFFPEWI